MDQHRGNPSEVETEQIAVPADQSVELDPMTKAVQQRHLDFAQRRKEELTRRQVIVAFPIVIGAILALAIQAMAGTSVWPTITVLAGLLASVTVFTYGYLQGSSSRPYELDQRKFQKDSGVSSRNDTDTTLENPDPQISAKYRLLQEIGDLKRRASVNIAIGGVATAIAIIVLAIPVLGNTISRYIDNTLFFMMRFGGIRPNPDSPAPTITWETIANEHGPRLALAIFAQLFAFFFLRMYRASLAEIRHFQNELTNIDLWESGVQYATKINDPTINAAVVAKLMNTERNFVLTKDQTTVDIEKARLDQQERTDLLKNLSDWLKSKKD